MLKGDVKFEYCFQENTPRLHIQVPKFDLDNVWNARRTHVISSSTDSTEQTLVNIF